VQVLSLISPFQVMEAAGAKPATLPSRLSTYKVLNTGFMT
jgi:hypothetical protein